MSTERMQRIRSGAGRPFRGELQPDIMSHSDLSPLALSFEEALCSSRFLEQMTSAAEHQMRAQIAEHGNHAFGLALAGTKFSFDAGKLQVVFEGGIPAGAKLLKSGGKNLPALVDGKTGKLLKWGRVTSKGRSVASIAANSALIVVEAAHMISSHDNAKRLKTIERSMDRLVFAHESEIRARLEAIYRYSKELLINGPASLTAEDVRELHRQSRDVMELRARLRDDFRHKISLIDPAKAGASSKLLRWKRKRSLDKSRQVKALEFKEALEYVHLMHFSLMLQMALAGSAGKLDAFKKGTIPDECKAWHNLEDFAMERSKKISGADNDAQFAEILGFISELSNYWKSIQVCLPSNLETKSPSVKSPKKRHRADRKL